MSYRLFEEGASVYDLHTPPEHYQHDHLFVLEELSAKAPGLRLLDIGCGTGVFLEKARSHGFEVRGLDASPRMAEIARARVGEGIDCKPMQELDGLEIHDAIVSLSWSFNYCASLDEARKLSRRFFRALRPGGLLILQVAHAPNATGLLSEDREPGPSGTVDDVSLFYRFSNASDDEPRVRADYVFACRSTHQLFFETHLLNAADADRIGALLAGTGFTGLSIFDSWQREPLDRSLSPFVLARKPSKSP